jgi:surfactin synthase thioesterase subunit
MYARWQRRLPAWISVVPVELPGRGRRMGEPLETTFAGLLARVQEQVRPRAGLPFALFGHSLGALVAFEVAWRRELVGASAPLVVFAAGTHAPSRREPERYANLTSDAELRAELERLDGTPASVLEDAELMALTLPILRADFQVAADYECSDMRRIGAPLHVFAGAEDATTPQTLEAWREHTRAAFFLNVLPGGHFFVQQQEPTLLALIEGRLREELGRTPATSAEGPRTSWRQEQMHAARDLGR